MKAHTYILQVLIKTENREHCAVLRTGALCSVEDRHENYAHAQSLQDETKRTVFALAITPTVLALYAHNT